MAFADVPTKIPPDHIRGEKLYRDLCWQCHGKKGLGNGPQSKAVKAPALAGVARKRFSQLVQVIQNGKGLMPAYEQVIDRHDSKRILQWLTRLDSKTGVDRFDKEDKKSTKKTEKTVDKKNVSSDDGGPKTEEGSKKPKEKEKDSDQKSKSEGKKQ